MSKKKTSKKKRAKKTRSKPKPPQVPKIVFLSTRTFVGSATVYRPSHYWGTLNDGEDDHELMHRLTLLQARNHHAAEQQRNKVLYDEDETTQSYQAGDEVDFFWSENAVKAAAVRAWEKAFPHALILLHGKAISHFLDICEEPCQVLAVREGQEELGEALSEAWDRYRAARDVEDELTMQSASDSWVTALVSAGLVV